MNDIIEINQRKRGNSMEQEMFKKIQNGNSSAIKKLLETNMRQTWFLSYYMTLDTAIAAPLLIKTWQDTLNLLYKSDRAPRNSFLCLLSSTMLSIWKKGISPDSDFKDLEIPKVEEKYQMFTDQIILIESENRAAYLAFHFGEASMNKVASALKISEEKAAENIRSASSQITENIKKQKILSGAKLLRTYTDFRCSDRRGTDAVNIPKFLEASLKHSLSIKYTQGKDSVNMNPTQSKKKRNKKIRKIIITIGVICIVAAVGSFTFTYFSASRAIGSEITTSYVTEEVTYGDVDSTISSSGTLTPVSNQVLNCDNPFTIDSINVEVGDTVSEGDVIAVITETVTTTTVNEQTREMEEETSTQETKIKAPFDGIVTELPLSEDESADGGSEIAVIMGTDGFLLNLSVDELDIANVSIGQEVTVTVDAVDGEYTGSVSNVSYNGTTSGSNTYYQITAQIDYEEGIYSGMSTSAEIVTESSGDGLLVPVNAVRTSGDDSYIFLAPSDAEIGDSYTEDEISEDDLTKVTVDTDMSDGSYIMIESDEISEGDLILIKEVSTNSDGSDSDSNSGGGFGGGMDFGNMDFSNFDPDNMPQGGGQPGNFGSGS